MKTHITLTKMFAAAILAAGLNNAALAQTCQAAFTYTVGSAGQVDFTNTSIGGGAQTQYYWSFGDNSSAQQQTPSTHTYLYNGNYTAYLYMTDSLNGGGCSSTYTAVIAINNTNTCNLAVSYTYSIGSNGQVSFTNTSTGINPGMIVQWNLGDGNTSNQLSPMDTYFYNGSYGVGLTISDTMGYCVGSQFDTIVISNAQNPPSCNASFVYTQGANGLVTFSGSDTGNVPYPSYTWDFGDGSTGYGINATHTYTYNGSFNVYFYVTDSMTGNSICSYMQQISVSSTSNNCTDSVYFYMIPDTSQASSWYVYLYSNNYNSMVNAEWSWGDGTSSTGLYPSHSYSTPGMYSICATVYFACGDTVTYCQSDSVYRSASQMISVHVVNTQSGIQNLASAATSLKAYPNPFNEELSISFASSDNQEMTCSLYDMMGGLVMKENVLSVKGENLFKMKTGDLGNGVYFVRLNAKDGSSTTLKVVK